jgi:multidrug efflux system membrane fusion protein
VGEFTARKADIPVMVEALGTVMPMVTATVRPQVSGVLKQVLFTEGQMVKQGQVLAVIDPQPFQIALTQATGARIRDEAQLENAKLTLERYRTLLSQDSIARQDVDTQASLVKQLEGTVTIDRANEATARLNLGYSRIVAPVAGRVGLRIVDTGNYISAGDTNGVAVITQMSPIDVSFALPQDRVPELQARMAEGVKLPATALDRTRVTQLDAGVFSTLDNQIDTTTGTVKAKARFPNSTGTLFPSQFVNLRLRLRTIEGAVVVPVTAIRTGSQGDFVYVLNEDRTVSLRNVKRGEATNEYIAIAEGLQAGERVVTEGADRLKDGARVQLAADRAASAASGASAPGRRASGAFGGASGPRRRASDAAGGGDWAQRRAASGAQGDGRP